MTKKRINTSGGIVYSTSSDYKMEENTKLSEVLPKDQQPLKIILDKKHRGGKVVTIIYGFQLAGEETQSLSKKLKAFCGCGGTLKDNEIIIQGDHGDKVLQWLLKNGYVKTRKI